MNSRKPPVARQNLDIPVNPVATTSETPDDQNVEEELAWCVHQLKLSLNSKKLSTKQSTYKYSIIGSIN